MKAYSRIIVTLTAVIAVVFLLSNLALISDKGTSGRPYKVEISRISRDIEEGRAIDISSCEYVTGVTEYCEDFYNTESDYAIEEINGKLYRIDYTTHSGADKTRQLLTMNIALAVLTAVIFAVLTYIKVKILTPFEKLSDVPYELSKGNLTAPVKETKNRFFGRFIWGVDLLRENMEEQKERELNLQRDRKMLLLSLSHDRKTPLSAIKLYSKALSKGLYTDSKKQIEIAENINSKADEIEGYVSQIITASREDFLSFDVKEGEFYLSELITEIKQYYTEKLSLIKTEFTIAEYTDCLLTGDKSRSVEVLQNIIENAIKYGNGKEIAIIFSEEEGCQLITVKNSGASISETELTHIFESFWRGENSENVKGSGLGLYICRQLMNKMNGDIFAEISDGYMFVTAVFTKA
ncbi:MAG: HAMP domain-containing histidine kinase [Ruminococcus sp.]|nr:HAMP domain-containing histidine kinase [Ruminococcus sp.]